MSSQPHQSVPGIEPRDAGHLATTLQSRLVSLLDLQLALKHIHWNIVGPSFLSVHEMLDEQVEPVREMADELAERIATLGGEPNGNPGAIVEQRTWDDYSLRPRHVPDPPPRNSTRSTRGSSPTIARPWPTTGVPRPDHRGHPHRPDRQAGDVPVVRPLVHRTGRRNRRTVAGQSGHSCRRSTATHARPRMPGREPTTEEALAAEKAAAEIDVDAVEKPYREMTRTGPRSRAKVRSCNPRPNRVPTEGVPIMIVTAGPAASCVGRVGSIGLGRPEHALGEGDLESGVDDRRRPERRRRRSGSANDQRSWARASTRSRSRYWTRRSRSAVLPGLGRGRTSSDVPNRLEEDLLGPP